MSIFLPGSVLGFIIYLKNPFFDEWVTGENIPELILIGVAVSAIFFLGIFFQMLGYFMNDNFYKWTGLFYRTHKVFTKSKSLEPAKEFVRKQCVSYLKADDYSKVDSVRFGHFFDVVYYQLEVKAVIEPAKSYQSFFFFFRNFLTLSILLFLYSTLEAFVCSSWNENAVYLFLSAAVLLISYLSAKWSQHKMVEKVFWLYYSIHNEH